MLNLVRKTLPLSISLAAADARLFVSAQDEEARLYSTPHERELIDSLGTLFSLIVSLEYLERAYVRDSVAPKECVLFLLWVLHRLWRG